MWEVGNNPSKLSNIYMEKPRLLNFNSISTLISSSNSHTWKQISLDGMIPKHKGMVYLRSHLPEFLLCKQLWLWLIVFWCGAAHELLADFRYCVYCTQEIKGHLLPVKLKMTWWYRKYSQLFAGTLRSFVTTYSLLSMSLCSYIWTWIQTGRTW